MFGTKNYGSTSVTSDMHPAKPPELIKNVNYCIERIINRGMLSKQRKLYYALQNIATARERISNEHLMLQKCYVDIIRGAVTHPDMKVVDAHII
jgi:hypothetical protein